MYLVLMLGQCKGVICTHRKVASKDHKLVYWIAGSISALSVLLEKKARRSELALYVLPRAGESLWYILVNRQLLPDIRNAEVLPTLLPSCFHEICNIYHTFIPQLSRHNKSLDFILHQTLKN
jgi:hypothetical protein